METSDGKYAGILVCDGEFVSKTSFHSREELDAWRKGVLQVGILHGLDVDTFTRDDLTHLTEGEKHEEMARLIERVLPAETGAVYGG